MNRFVKNGCWLPLRAAWPDTRRGPSCGFRRRSRSALVSPNLDLESHQPVLVVIAGPSTRVIHAPFDRPLGSPNRAPLGLENRRLRPSSHRELNDDMRREGNLVTGGHGAGPPRCR